MKIENNASADLLLSTINRLINEDYAFLDLPYYCNVGDILIWESTEQIMKKIKHRCVYSCSVETYRKPKIGKNIILLFSGGGNFGDLWEKHQIFRHKIMEDFPSNPIVQLPQSVWFECHEKMLQDIQYFNKHKAPITICVRDKQSFDIIKNNYNNVTPLLLPDMVLGLDIDRLLRKLRINRTKGEGQLYFKRDDKEFVEHSSYFPFDAEGDWPCRQNTPPIVDTTEKFINMMKKIHMPTSIRLTITNWIFHHIIKKKLLKDGINFIMPFSTIYATRLHAGILGALLEKKIYLMDNSYNKLSGVYNLWMKDMKNIELL